MAILRNLVSTLTRDYPKGNPALVSATYPATGYVIDPPPAVPGLIANVTAESATGITAVYRAVQLIASTIAALPLHVYEKDSDGQRIQVERAMDAYLWRRPNREVPNVIFWETVVGHEVLAGNAYIYVETKGGEPYQLWPILPHRVTTLRDEQGDKYYVVDGNTVFRDFLYGGEIVHVPGWGYDGLQGLSPIKQHALALGLTRTVEEFAGRFFANGTTLSGVLSTDQPLDKDKAAELRDRWQLARAGANNAHKAAVLSSGLKWTPISINAEDSQLLQLREFQVAEVARMFGIMPEGLLSSHEKTSSFGTGMGALLEAFARFTLQPHIIRFEQTINDELLQRGDAYVKFEIGGLLRGTPMERAQYQNIMRNMGVLSVNDVRALEDLPLIGPEGDTRIQPLNMAPLGNPADSQTLLTS